MSQPSTVSVDVTPTLPRQSLGREALLIAGFGVAHLLAVWGTVGLAWGDYGVWLHAVERVAAGERPYIDFYWMYPPLALWLVGSVAAVFGTSLPVIWTTTSVIYGAALLLYWIYVRSLVPNGARLAVLALGLILAAAYANNLSAPFPMGMYTPAAPLSGVFLILGAVLLLRIVRSSAPNAPLALGVVAGLALFTKQDAWLPMAVAIGVALGVMSRRRQYPGVARLVAGLCAVLALEFFVLAMQTGWDKVGWAFWTPRLLDALGGRGLPTWERLTAQAGATSLLFFIFGLFVLRYIPHAQRVTRSRVLFAGAVTAGCFLVHVAMSVRTGLQLRVFTPDYVTPVQEAMQPFIASMTVLIKGAVRFYATRVLWFALPPLLPVCVATWLFVKGNSSGFIQARNALLILLAYAVAARVRRQFEMVDWYHPLLELPVYAAVLGAVFRDAGKRGLRAVTASVLLILPVAAGVYYMFGRGPGTRRKATASFSIHGKGTVLVAPNVAQDLKWLRSTLDSVDPSGRRPLMTYGQTAGFNYFVNRKSASSLMYGFRLTHVTPDSIVREIGSRSPPPILLDLPIIDRLTEVQRRVDLGRWDVVMGPTAFLHDRPHFGDLLRKCRAVSRKGNEARPFFVLYDCR